MRARLALPLLLLAAVPAALLLPAGTAPATAGQRVAARQPARRLALRRGQRLTVEQALKALMIVSANDVAVMLAEAAGGSVRPVLPGHGRRVRAVAGAAAALLVAIALAVHRLRRRA